MQWNYLSIPYPDNGLAPAMQEAIILTNDG